jgi:hypothetical protein
MIAIYSYEQSLHCRVQLPLVVFVTPDGEWSIFLSSQQLRWLYLSAEIFGLKNHEWHLVPWSISVSEGLHNGSYCLRCYLCVCKLCFPTASFVSYTLIADLALWQNDRTLSQPKSKSIEAIETDVALSASTIELISIMMTLDLNIGFESAPNP